MMRSEKELDMECYFPQKPIKWTDPITESYMIDWYKQEGWLDEEGNITMKGRNDIDLCPDMMNGTETEEHFQKRMRLYKKQLDFCYKWFDAKYGTPDTPGDYRLPFPEEEYRKITLDTIDD